MLTLVADRIVWGLKGVDGSPFFLLVTYNGSTHDFELRRLAIHTFETYLVVSVRIFNSASLTFASTFFKTHINNYDFKLKKSY
jgi:hypothetical protein